MTPRLINLLTIFILAITSSFGQTFEGKIVYTNQYKSKLANVTEFISKSGALPLKMIIDSPQFILESIAREVTPMKLDDIIFQLPADAKLAKSPY